MKKIVFSVLVLALSGCASVKNTQLAPDDRAALNNKKVLIVEHEKPSFVAMTPGKAAFALVGALAAMNAGNSLVEEKHLIDPTVTVGQSLETKLAERYSMQVSTYKDKVKTDDTKTVSKFANGDDYVLYLNTNGWGFMYHGLNLSDYRFDFRVNMRLIDTASQSVVAEGTCSYPKSKNKDPELVSYDTLVANDAAYLKKQIADGSEFCSNYLMANVL